MSGSMRSSTAASWGSRAETLERGAPIARHETEKPASPRYSRHHLGEAGIILDEENARGHIPVYP